MAALREIGRSQGGRGLGPARGGLLGVPGENSRPESDRARRGVERSGLRA